MIKAEKNESKKLENKRIKLERKERRYFNDNQKENSGVIVGSFTSFSLQNFHHATIMQKNMFFNGLPH